MVLEQAEEAEDARDELERNSSEIQSLCDATLELDQELVGLAEELREVESDLEEVVTALSEPIREVCERSISYKQPKFWWDGDKNVLQCRYTREAGGGDGGTTDYLTQAVSLQQFAQSQVDKIEALKDACEGSCSYELRGLWQPIQGQLWCEECQNPQLKPKPQTQTPSRTFEPYSDPITD